MPIGNSFPKYTFLLGIVMKNYFSILYLLAFHCCSISITEKWGASAVDCMKEAQYIGILDGKLQKRKKKKRYTYTHIYLCYY